MGTRKTYGDGYITGGLEIVGNTTIQGNLNVEGTMVFEDAISASSDVTVSGTLTASSGFKATAASSFSGTLKVDNTLTASSGFLGTANSSFSGTLKVTKTLTASSGFANPVEAATTAALTLKPYGISTIDAPTTGSRTWTLGTPVAGYTKTIQCIAAASTLSPRNVICGSAISFLTSGSTTANKIRMFKEGDSVTLNAYSATVWGVTAKTGSVLFSASTSTT